MLFQLHKAALRSLSLVTQHPTSEFFTSNNIIKQQQQKKTTRRGQIQREESGQVGDFTLEGNSLFPIEQT